MNLHDGYSCWVKFVNVTTSVKSDKGRGIKIQTYRSSVYVKKIKI